ncbi:MAG TPA: hypothetical protein EYN06_00080 [Myxococcales bacterium]|nr:hypothetical protein [Myxococcales bacterium]HIN84845.1 hypothetical protein [Myxococcales bacterium]
MRKTLLLGVFVVAAFTNTVAAEPFTAPAEMVSPELADAGTAEMVLEFAPPPVRDPSPIKFPPLNFNGSGADDGGCSVGMAPRSNLWWLLLPALLLVLRTRRPQTNRS